MRAGAPPRRGFRTRRPALPASGRAGFRAAPAGCLGSRRRSDRAPGCPSGRRSAESSSSRASATGRPVTSSSVRPASSSPGTRTPKTMPTDSAPRRRATNARAFAEALSTHCWSSIRHSSGWSSATSDNRLKTAIRSGTGPAPTPRSYRTLSAARPAVAPADGRAGPASAHTTDAARRTPTPSRTGLPPHVRSGTPTPVRPNTPAGRSCRRRPPRTPPATGSHRCGSPPPVVEGSAFRATARQARRTAARTGLTKTTVASERSNSGPRLLPDATLRRSGRYRRTLLIMMRP